jgi:hypothetical protein
MKKTLNPQIDNFPKASGTNTRSQSRYAAQDYKQLIADAITIQIKQQEQQLTDAIWYTSTLSALLPHTKRDSLEFLRDKISVRLQLCFSPMDNIEAKIVIPRDGDLETDKNTIPMIIVEIDRLHHGLLQSWWKWMNKNHPKTLPRRFSSFLEDQTLRHRYLATHIEILRPLLLEFFSNGLPTDYFIDEKLTSTPRVIAFWWGYLLTQNNPLVYEEKHLQKYSWTDLFFRYFPTKAAYLAYEQQTIAKLEQQKTRFILWNEAYKLWIHEFITERKASIENNNKKPFGTSTDKRIDQELNKLLEKKNTQYFSHYIIKIGQLLQDRLDAIDAMTKTIQAQIEWI